MSTPPPTWKRLARGLLPPLLAQAIERRVRRGTHYAGDYGSWADARRDSTGYDAPLILERALAATRAVRDGEAAWERDTVRFAQPEYHWPVLSGLLRAAAAEGGRLNVLDFGGAFGSTWWQHRAWFAGLAEVRWSVVEQAAFVRAGQREFTAGPLRFYETLEACCAAEQPTTLVLSGVLPYLETPHAFLAEVARRNFRHVLIDRAGFTHDGRDLLTVQQVPPEIYPASYPCWFLDRGRVAAAFARDYRLVAEWDNEDRVNLPASFRGCLLERTAP